MEDLFSSMKVLRENFQEHLISLHGDILRSAHSPDLSPCNHFLSKSVKAQFFKCRLSTTDELKDFICYDIIAITEVCS